MTSTVRLRVLDYVANGGGGLRFVTQMVKALDARDDFEVEVASHGEALGAYRRVFAEDAGVRLLDLRPTRLLRSRGLSGFRGSTRLNSLLHLDRFHYEVPSAAWAGCDILWFPWLHRHRVPERAPESFATLHDLTMLQFHDLFPSRWRASEYETVRRWLDAPARVAVSSVATAQALTAVFGCAPDRVEVIPLSGMHDEAGPARSPRRAWAFAETPYIVCPATINPHKNHEVLFDGTAKAARRHPLVLTGAGTNFWSARSLSRRRTADGGEGSRTGLGSVADRTGPCPRSFLLLCPLRRVGPRHANPRGGWRQLPRPGSHATGCSGRRVGHPGPREMIDWSRR